MKTARDIMTRDVKTIPAEATLREAAELLSLYHISGAPVVDAAGNVVGILSESDLLSEARKRAALPSIAAFGLFRPVVDALQRIYHDGATLLVEEVMTRKVENIGPETSLHEIGDILARRRINRLPVVDDDGKLLGIITREDLLKAIFHLDEATT